MTAVEPRDLQIRPAQYQDLSWIEQWLLEPSGPDSSDSESDPKLQRQLRRVRQWYYVLQILRLFPNPWRYWFWVYVGEALGQARGMIQVSPVNRTRSTWCVDRVAVSLDPFVVGEKPILPSDVGSQLLRYCLQTIWEARTWVLEVDVNDKAALALYRQNGFQPLAQMTYWAISPQRLQDLAEREPSLPNLLPVSNADAQLLYQLDTAAMPPLVRQVFDRHIHDFKTSLVGSLAQGLRQWLQGLEVVTGYVFETQRKAAIGYFQLKLSRHLGQAHEAQLTVHPAYTWLYPELMAQMARITQAFPEQDLHLASADYQPEREAYLEQVGATRIAHTMLMSRSVWHKLREAKAVSLEALQLSEMLQSLQASRKPIPGRITLQPSGSFASLAESPFSKRHAYHLSSRIRCW
jgi:hypothetical protein